MHNWREIIRGRLAKAKLEASRENEIVEELAQHLEDRCREWRGEGAADDECYLRAMEELKQQDILAAALRFRGERTATADLGVPSGGHLLGGFFHDLNVGLRGIGRKPFFSLMVIGLLAIGIGGDAAIFSVFDSLVLRPLPFAEPDRLVDLDETAPKWNLKFVGISSPDLHEWRKDNGTFDSMAFFRGPSYNLAYEGRAERVRGAQVSREMLDVLRLTPVLGRNFDVPEDQPGGPKVVLLSYGLWQTVFHGDREILGQVLKLDEEGYTVVGVLPREAVFPDRAEVWTPLAADPNTNTGYYVAGVGRLRRGVTLEQARSDLLRVHKAMISAGSKVNEITSPVVTPLHDRYLGSFKTISGALLGAVGLVMLIVCVNIAALLLVRGSFRSREMGIRVAMGASRWRLTSQLMTESALLAGAGGVCGVLLGSLCLHAIASTMPASLPEWITFSLDARFAIFCVVVTGAAALLFGLGPALQTSKVDIRASLQGAAGRTTASRGQRLVLGGLVACEIALALMLSVSAGLLVEAFRKVLEIEPGFRPENVLTFHVSLPEETYNAPDKKTAYFNNLLGQLRALPDVRAAGAASAPPLGGSWGGVFETEGNAPPRAEGENPVILQVAATPGYFEAIGMTLMSGRTFDARDEEPNARRVAVVNQTFAKHFWSDGSALGKRIKRFGGNEWLEVIGVVRDEKHYGLEQETKPSVFLPYREAMATALRGDERALQDMSIVLRSANDPQMVTGEAREIVQRMDADVPMYEVHTMTEELDRSLWARRAYSWLFGVFSGVAILLAAAGVYGTLSYVVSQRTQEIGIRIALGARPGQVLWQVLRGGMLPVAAGAAAGLLGALWVTNLLKALLFGVQTHDPAIFGAMVFGVALVGVLANLVPAWRAARVDPTRALRFE